MWQEVCTNLGLLDSDEADELIIERAKGSVSEKYYRLIRHYKSGIVYFNNTKTVLDGYGKNLYAFNPKNINWDDFIPSIEEILPKAVYSETTQPKGRVKPGITNWFRVLEHLANRFPDTFLSMYEASIIKDEVISEEEIKKIRDLRDANVKKVRTAWTNYLARSSRKES